MIVIYINDFLFTSKRRKFYPFLEIIEHLKNIKRNDINIKFLTLSLLIDNSDDWQELEKYSFFKRDAKNLNVLDRNKWILNIKAILLGFPLFLFKRIMKFKNENTVVHITSGFIPIFYGSIICKILDIPCIIGPNAVPSKNLLYKGISDLQDIIYFIRDFIISKFTKDFLICFSKYHKKSIVHKFKLNEERIKIINIGINEKYFKRIEVKSFKNRIFGNNNKIILYVGVPIKDKGFNQFIRVSKKLLKENSEINILMVGIKDLELLNELKKEFIHWRDNIKIFGWISRSELSKFYNIADIYINPSKDETWSMTTVEALACGTPCICSKIPIFEVHIIEDFNGLLFRRNDDTDLVSEIEKALNKNWNRYEISIRALKSYDWKIQTKKLLTIYRNLIQNQ